MLNVLDILAGLMFTENPGDEPKDPPETLDGSGEDAQTVPISELRKVRSEAAGYRTQLRELQSEVEKMKVASEKAKKEAERAEMEEVEKYKSIAADAQTEAQKATEAAAKANSAMQLMAKKQAVFTAANNAGFHHPGDANLHLDLNEIEIMDGKVDTEKVDLMIAELAEKRADLLSEQPASSFGTGPTNPPNPKLPGAKLTDQQKQEKAMEEYSNLLGQGKFDKALELYNEIWEKKHAG